MCDLRVLPAVTGRRNLTFTVANLTNVVIKPEDINIVRDAPNLPYGTVHCVWKSVALGPWFHPGCLFESEYDMIRASFAWDGDLYGWDEAIVYTRKPIVVIASSEPYLAYCYTSETVDYGVNWLQRLDRKLHGGYVEEARRKDLVAWTKNGIPEGPLQLYDASERASKSSTAYNVEHDGQGKETALSE
jgi:hypothetical protein